LNLRVLRGRPPFLWLLDKEWRELVASRSWWVLLLVMGPLVGVSFISAVRTYAELSGLNGTAAGVGEAFSPLIGVWAPTFSACELGRGIPAAVCRHPPGRRRSSGRRAQARTAGADVGRRADCGEDDRALRRLADCLGGTGPRHPAVEKLRRRHLPAGAGHHRNRPFPQRGTDDCARGRDRFADRASNAKQFAYYPVAVLKGTDSFSNGTISVKFKTIAGEADRASGLLFNVKSNGDWLAIRYNDTENNIALWEFHNGIRRPVKFGPPRQWMLDRAQWHELKMTVAGADFTAFIDGKPALEYRLGSQPGPGRNNAPPHPDLFPANNPVLRPPVAGKIGLWAKTDSTSYFKDYVVRCGESVRGRVRAPCRGGDRLARPGAAAASSSAPKGTGVRIVSS
jgi:hypothetical protein